MEIYAPLAGNSSAPSKQYVESYLNFLLKDDNADPDFIITTKIKERPVNLDNPSKSYVQKQKQQPDVIQKTSSHIFMTHKQRKAAGFYRLKGRSKNIAASKSVPNANEADAQAEVSFEKLDFMHQMWLEYMCVLIGNSSGEEALPKLLKADYHGCIIKVSSSKNPQLVGIEGMVLEESSNSFTIITPHTSCIKVIPKRSTIFSFNIKRKNSNEESFLLFGSQFSNLSAVDRVSKKFKVKPTIQL